MDIKRKFKEDKGGFGVFLILVIMGLAIYAFQKEEPAYDYAVTEAENNLGADAEVINTTEPVGARQPFTQNPLPDSAGEDKTNPESVDSAAVALEKKEAAEKAKIAAASTKAKPKAKPRPVRKRISKEELVRSKLRAGMSVREVAKVTGLEKKYIREIKRRKGCNCN